MTFLGLNIAFTGLTCCLLPILTRWPVKHKKYEYSSAFGNCLLVGWSNSSAKWANIWNVLGLLSPITLFSQYDVAAGPLCDRGLHHSGVHHGTSPESTLHPGVNIVDGKVFLNHFISASNTALTLYVSNPNFRHCMQQLVLGSCSQHFSSNLSFPP